MTGVDYYPEHWDPELWDRDIRLMRESGVEIVERGSGTERYLLIFNNSPAKAYLHLPDVDMELKPYETRVHACRESSR